MEKSNGLPLFEVCLLLKDSRYIFSPSFMENDKNSFITLIDNIIQDIFDMANQLPRIINDTNIVLLSSSSKNNITTYKSVLLFYIVFLINTILLNNFYSYYNKNFISIHLTILLIKNIKLKIKFVLFNTFIIKIYFKISAN